MADDGIEVFVSGYVGAGAFVALSDATGAVDEDFIEAALVGLMCLFVAEVPFTKDAGGLAAFFEGLGKSGGLEGHAFALEDGVGDPVFERMPTGHERGTGG